MRAVARVGIPSGIAFGLIQYLMTGSAPRALFGCLFFGVTFGGFTAWSVRRRWRQSSELAPDDRATVARAVRKGEDIPDERLADAVVDYAAVVRQAEERDARQRWVLVAFAIMTLIGAIVLTVVGSTREAVVFWLLSVFWVVNLTWLIPARRARAVANARRAEEAARFRSSQAGDS
jgi:hypothetical protein